MSNPPDRPNLLIVWTDEQRADTMSCYGNDFIHVPNLNRLASESFVFDRAYCCQPVCTPSRGSVMTGLYPNRHGSVTNNVALHADSRTIAELVDPAYRRAYHGKWHLGDEIVAQHGFDEWVSTEDGIYRAYYSKPEYLERRSSYHHYLAANGYPPDSEAADGGYCYSRNLAAAMPYRFTKAGFLARESSAFLRQHDQTRPFVLSVNFLEPHMPFFGPFNDWYDPAELPVGPAFNVPPSADASLRHRAWHAKFKARGFEEKSATESGWRRLRANYYGLVTMVDKAVGQILDALQDSGLADRTIVVFTSDHGDMMGDHAMLTKGVLYEEAVRIPWLIRVPWLSRQQRLVPGRISQIDMVPTLLDLMGQPIPPGLAGRSRRAVLEGSATLAGNDVVVLWRGDSFKAAGIAVPGASAAEVAAVGHQDWLSLISADGWKLNLCATDPCCELYDLNSDPHELTNLYGQARHHDRIRDLTARLRDWQQTHGYTDIALPGA